MKIILSSLFALSLSIFAGANARADAGSRNLACSVAADASGFRTVQTDLLGETEDGSLPTYSGFVLNCANLGNSPFLFLGDDAQKIADLVIGEASVTITLVSSGGGIEGRGVTKISAVSSDRGTATAVGHDISRLDGFHVIIRR